MKVVEKSRRTSRWILLALVMAGVFGLAVSALDFAAMRGYLDLQAGDGRADPYTRELHQRIMFALRCAGAVFIVLALVIVFIRERFERQAGMFLGAWWRDLKSAVHAARSFCSDRSSLMTLLVITGIAVVLRIQYLDVPVRFDEAYTYLFYASKPAIFITTVYNEPNNHVFHSLCLHFVSFVLPNDPWALRIPAVMAGILMVPLAFLLGNAWQGRIAGTLAALLCAVSPPLIDYSVNGRGYTMIWFLGFTLLLLGDYILRQRNLAGWSLLAFFAALGMWTIPTMLYVVAAVLAWLPIAHFRSAQVADYEGRFPRYLIGVTVGIGLLTLFCYLPIFVVTGSRWILENPYVASDWQHFAGNLTRHTLEALERSMIGSPPWMLVMLLVGIFCFYAFPPNNKNGRFYFLPVMVVCHLAIMLLQKAVPPERVWLGFLPFVFLLVGVGYAAGIERLSHPGLRRIGMTMLLGVLAVWPGIRMINATSIRDSGEMRCTGDLEQIAMDLKLELASVDRIAAMCPMNAPLIYHARRHDLPMQHFETPPSQSVAGERLFVIVSDLMDQAVQDVLLDGKIPDRFRLSQTTAPRKYSQATVYTLDALEHHKN